MDAPSVHHGEDTRMDPQQLPPIKTAITSHDWDTRANGSTNGRDSAKTSHHQRILVADPVAFRYLEHDPTTTVLGRRREITGFQAYVVEQWTCTRTHPTFVIVSYTGDPSHKLYAGVLSVPADEEAWSPKLRVYFRILVQQYNGRRRDTPLGSIIVTSLSGFPSSLTLLPIENGDVRTCRDDFFVNENLKRLGCSGRVGMTLDKPSSSAEAKFYQLYRTSEKIPLYSAVVELVKLCQIALLLFGKLGSEYADGLLCDITEKAIGDWWRDIGTELYNTEPNEGTNTIGPTTIAALLGTLLGARNRLHAYGAPVSKDAFDLEATKRGIAYFQKSQKLPKHRRLDRATLLRLHKSTQKQALSEGWTVPRAVKSTVADLSGKGGEMVMDIVGGGKDKSLISEVETTDIERFTQLIKGDRAKWLWHGKAHKRNTRDLFRDEAHQSFPYTPTETENNFQEEPPNENGNVHRGELKQLSSSTSANQIESVPSHPRSSVEFQTRRYLVDKTDGDSLRKQTMLNRAKGRFKGAVTSARGTPKPAADDLPPNLQQHPSHSDNEGETASDEDGSDSPFASSPDARRGSDLSSRDGGETDASRRPSTTVAAAFAKNMTQTPIEASADDRGLLKPPGALQGRQAQLKDGTVSLEAQIQQMVSAQRVAAERVGRETTIPGGFPKDRRPAQSTGLLLRSSRSFSKYETDFVQERADTWWPRRLSFSTAEDAVLGDFELNGDAAFYSDSEGEDGPHHADGDASATPGAARGPRQRLSPRDDLAELLLQSNDQRRLRQMLADLGARVGHPTTGSLKAIKSLGEMIREDVEQLNELYYTRSGELGKSEQDRLEMIEGERAELTAHLRDVDTLSAKLQYELDTLRGKVEDVESAVSEFERQVDWTEGRVEELVREGERSRTSWWDAARRWCNDRLAQGRVASREPAAGEAAKTAAAGLQASAAGQGWADAPTWDGGQKRGRGRSLGSDRGDAESPGPEADDKERNGRPT